MLRKSFSFLVRGALLFLLAVFMVAGASQVQAQSRGADQFQYWVTIEKDMASVRAQQGDFKEGPAAMFERRADGWQRLERAGRESSNEWATRTPSYALALDGDYAIVGAQWHDGFKGAAYIFKRKGDGWTEVQKLSPPDLERFDHLGSSVSISGDYAAVAATWHDLFRGAVYVFKRDGKEWIQQDKLTASDARADDRFGRTVRIDGSEITIGNASADLQGAGMSLAYRFLLSNDAWAEGQKVALPTVEKTDAYPDRLLIESETSSDVLALAEIVGTNTEMPPLLAPTAPPPPSAVVATDGAFEDRVEIVWSRVDMDAIVYRIERNGTLISAASSDDSLYSDETGEPGLTYNYCVIVVDMEGKQSAPACDLGSRIIFPPSSLWASDGHFDRFVRLVWTDMSSVEAGFLIKRNGEEIGTTTANVAVFEDDSAETMVTYEYQVIAFDADDNRATPVADSGFRGVILPPLNVSASDGEYPDFVRITWIDQAENEQGYYIYRGGSLIDSTGAGTDSMSYDDDGAVNGVSYDYCVTTRGSSSEESIPVCDEGGRGILPAPEYVIASDSTFDDRVEITWDDPSDLEDGFEILRDGVVIDSTVANVTFYKDISATPDSTHLYCVAAFSDEGGRSAEVCDTGFQSIVLAPFDVQATDGEREDRVDITWNSTSTTAVLFKIFRDTTFIKSVSRGTQSYSDYGGTAGQDYPYSVVAVTALLDPAQSEPDTGRRELRVPTEVAASDQEYEEKIVISWADNSRLENGYLLCRQDMSAAVDSVWLGSNRTSHTDFTAVPGVTYSYSLAAFDSLGEGLGFSASATDSGRRVLLPPSNVRATDGRFEKRVEITWEDNSDAEDGYRIYRDSVLIDSTADNFTSYVDTLPIPGQTSEYSVVAFDSYGKSEAGSDSGSTTILAPGSFNASDVYEDRVELSWVDLSEVEDGYVIFRDGAVFDSVGENVNSCTDTTAAPGVTYQYCVRAVRSGDYSAEVCDYGCVFQPEFPITSLYTKLLAGDPNVDDHFGRSVAISGDVAIIGAPYHTVGHPDAGAAYIFERAADGTWGQSQKLFLSKPWMWDYFGHSVAISGDVAVIGAYARDSSSQGGHPWDVGRAYIFERAADGSWPETETQELWASDPGSEDHFGISVAISGDVAVIGAYLDDQGGTDAGAAYVFERGSGGMWSQTQKLLAGDPDTGGCFGYSVAITGDVAVIGALHANSGTVHNAGAAYIFQCYNGNWPATETQKLQASDPDSDDQFGWSVAISGDVAIVGANAEDPGDSNNAGAAYIFECDAGGTWPETETKKLLAHDPNPHDWFGTSVAIIGDVAIVGATGDGQAGPTVGAAYIFERNADGTWPETQKLLPGDPGSEDHFGESVAMSGDVAIIGAFKDDQGAPNAGAAYIWPPGGTVVASDGSLNSRIRINWSYFSSNHDGFHVYRDGELIETSGPDIEVYEDYEAQPGRTYEYCVAAYRGVDEPWRRCDFGWRPPNGNITGNVSTRIGSGVEAISVGLDPQPTRSLLLDGTGGFVAVPDREGIYNFDLSQSYTVEAWLKYSGEGGEGDSNALVIGKGGMYGKPFPFRLTNRRGQGEPGQLEFAISDGTESAQVFTTGNTFNDGTWHHIACVHDADQDQIMIYADGEPQDTTPYLDLGNITNHSGLYFGGGFDDGTWFGGQIDEVRIWSVARSADQINATMNRLLTGKEENLVGYWPLDEDSRSAITDFSGENHYGSLHGGVYWAEDAAPLDIDASSDAEGNYVLDGIRYGEETTFEVRPYEGERQFSPAFKTITLSTGHPVENQVNFVEITSFTVSGEVKFAGTACGVQQAEIHVDGNLKAATDKNGKFAVAVDNGDHWVKPLLAGHTFEPDSVLLYVDGDTAGIVFTNTTVRALSGRVGGGCDRYIGDVNIFIRSENNCMETSFTVDSAYSIDLPPQKYLVRAEVVEPTIPDGLIPSDVVKFFENLGERDVDLTDSAGVLDFVYRAPLLVEIKGLEKWVPRDCEHLTFNGSPLPDSLPVVPQLTVLELIIEVNEYYGEDHLCPLDSGRVVIYDEIFDMQDSLIELVVRDGEAVYTTFASTPSLIAGRVDSEGKDRSFQKAIRARVVVEGRTPVTATEWALVTGHVAPQGADFVTAIGSQLPTYILRDPPGDGSYAYLEEGRSLRTTIDYQKLSLTTMSGVTFDAWVGVDADWFIGLGAGTIGEFAAKVNVSGEIMTGSMLNLERKTELTLTTKEKFSTSAAELFAGEAGDIFVGVGYNMIFAEVGVVGVSDCEVVRSSSVGFQPDSVATTFAYTQQYIRDVLIPEFDSKAQYYMNLEDPDSAGIFLSQADNWRKMLAANDSLKRGASVVENRSFSSGAEFGYLYQTELTKSYSASITIITDFKGALKVEIESDYGGLALGVNLNVRTEYVPFLDEGTGTYTQEVGYVFDDDDIGDHFTVDIKDDGRYPSPVFDVLAGVSSCPYEPWRDPEGELRMVPRDAPKLEVSGPDVLNNVPPDEPAAFTLTLANNSPTEEIREYVLRELTTSNPDGAVIKANGAPLANGVSYFINGDWQQGATSNTVTLTVERGPTKYNYPNLALILYPPCEYGIWEQGGPLQIGDTLLLTANFEAPCSDITLYRPEPGWTFNKAQQDSGAWLEMCLTDYELKISEDESVTSVGAQYRRLGTGKEGPTEWSPDIKADSLGQVQTDIHWYPDSGLADGVYELRAYTECTCGRGCRGYSGAVQGTIDRNAPQVLGTPEPADEELSLGEDISITFNEPIDCASINADGVLTYLDGPNAGDTIEVDWVCDGTSIVFTPASGVDPDDLEGRLLEARVAGVCDLVDNPMEGEEVWTFRVRQSVFTWSRTSLVRDVAFRAPGTITAELVNGNDSTAHFTIPTVPSWITEVSPQMGSIAPGGTQSISFTIQEDLALGSYDSVIVAESDHGNALLGVYLTVSCHEPVWEMDPGRYEHTMTIVAKVMINGTSSSDPDDRVAAFVGSQLRGVANVDSATHMVFLTVGSNRTWGETVRFQIWDDDSCRLYNSTLERFPFVSNDRIGSPDSPVMLTATDVLPEAVQVIPLVEGWTWFSTNVFGVDMSPDGVLSDLTPSAGDIIKSNTAFAEFDPDMGWVGTLQLLDNVSSYMIRLSEQGTILQEGSAVPDTTPIPVDDGWNWIGYLPTVPMAVERALEDLNKNLSDRDMVKSQTAFAQYDKKGTTWLGSLDSMEPCVGYKLYLANVPPGCCLTYSNGGGKAPGLPWAGIPEQDIHRETQTAEAEPGWSVNRHAYQYNMTVIAALNVEGNECRNDNHVIGAFVDGECRGIGRPMYLSTINRSVAFLMIHSNSVSGERVEFQAFIPEERAVYDVAEAMTYEADGAVGTIREPLLLSTEGIAFEVEENVPSTFSLSQNYPNPFNPMTRIEYGLPEQSQVTVEVFNILGQRVKTLVSAVQPAGRHRVVWDGKDDQGRDVGSGIYFYRLQAGEFSESKKMVILK